MRGLARSWASARSLLASPATSRRCVGRASSAPSECGRSRTAAKALQRELDVLVARECPQLLAEQGCGTLTAATIIGRIAGAERFATDSRFARQAGTAPIPASSAVAIDTAITAAATASSTARFTRSRSPEREGILRLRRTWRASAQRARATAKQSVV
jgi:transposase